MTNMERIHATYLVPVVVMDDAARAVDAAKALLAGGVDVMEITLRTPAGLDAIEAVAQNVPEMLVGAGTVLTTAQVDEALAAGAQFIVTPGMDVALVQYCQEKGVAVFPGCTTPTDYHAAYRLGLSVLKFFPAEQSGGLAKIKAMNAPFPMFKVMPTGGVSLQNLAEYAKSPIIAACGGSYMVTAALIDGQNWDEITRLCQESVRIVKEARNG